MVTFWVTLTTAVAVGLAIAAAWFALQAARTARTPQGAMGWAVFLASSPHFAVPLYLFLGHHRLKDYVVSRRASQELIDRIRERSADYAPDAGATKVNLAPFEQVAGLPASRGNGFELLINGQNAFKSIFQAIDEAEDYVLVQFYILRDDDQGRLLKTHMMEAARRGVSVYLLTDAIGSYGLTNTYLDELTEAGVIVADRSENRRPKNRFQINFRNHRKTVIVDGKTGFTGGLNVGVEYMGLDPYFGPWRDTHVRLTGPMVTQLQLIYAEDWHWITSDSLQERLDWTAPLAPDDMTGLIVATGPADTFEAGSLMFFSAIAAAQDRIWIASPYFVPDIDILSALKNAALRGVDVRLLVPDVIDHRLPWLAAFAYFDEVMEMGAKVYRYTDGFMHQKAFVVDDQIAAVGTHNLDNRSFRLNFEAMAMVFDPRAAKDVAAMLEHDIDTATRLDKRLDQQNWKVRYGAPVARLFSPLL